MFRTKTLSTVWRKNRSSRLHPVATTRTCPGCGAKFNSWGKIHKIYCSPQCGGARLTSEDTDTINAYRQLCKKYNLPPGITWAQISGYSRRSFYWPTGRVRKIKKVTRGNEGQGLLSVQTKNRYMAMMAKFVREFKAGMYDIIPPKLNPKYPLQPKARVKRRLTPGRPVCPMNLVHCGGGLFPGDCPKHWRECPLWSN